MKKIFTSIFMACLMIILPVSQLMAVSYTHNVNELDFTYYSNNDPLSSQTRSRAKYRSVVLRRESPSNSCSFLSVQRTARFIPVSRELRVAC